MPDLRDEIAVLRNRVPVEPGDDITDPLAAIWEALALLAQAIDRPDEPELPAIPVDIAVSPHS